MDQPASYCDVVRRLDDNNVHRRYHDTIYGFPVSTDDELFERLVLEINQAGLSWTTILHKQQNFRRAFHDFDIRQVASFKEADRQRLLQDAGIIRNRLKIDAAIHNAAVVLDLQKQFGSFKNWLDHHHPKTREEWLPLFKKTFRFTGGEIVNEFLMSTGYLPNAHIPSCPVYNVVMALQPPWVSVKLT